MRDQHLSLDAIVEEVRRILERNRPYYDAVRVRCATAAREDGGRRSCGWHAIAWTKQERPLPAESKHYPEVHLLEEWIDVERLPDLVVMARDQRMKVDGEEFRFETNFKNFPVKFLGGGNEHSRLPGVKFEISAEGRPPGDVRELFTYDLPFSADISEAVAEWNCIGGPNPTSSGRLGEGMLFLPECRARVVEVRRTGRTVRVRLENPATIERLRIRGAVNTGNAWESFQAEVADGEAQFRLPKTTEVVQFVLLGPDGTLFDRFYESPWQTSGIGRVLRAGADRGGAALVASAREAGEGDQVEFKPAIAPGKEGGGKLKEVVRTTIAFLNARGGTIFLGIEDDLTVTGIEKHVEGWVSREKKRTVGRALAERWYVDYLRARIGPQIVPSARIGVRIVSYDGHRVVLIEVPKGHGLHYEKDGRIKGCWIRRGASDAEVDLVRDRPALYQHEKQTWELPG